MCGCSSNSSRPTTRSEPLSGTVFHVEDMTCSHCAGTISRALKDGMPGVRYDVDLETQRVTVAGDPAVAAALIRAAGYEPLRQAA